MTTRLKPLEITKNIFEEIAEDKPDNFKEKVREHYFYLFRAGGCEPIIQERRLDDAWNAFRHDKKHLLDSLPSGSESGDHFKLSGILAYWLRRYAPVYDFRDLSVVQRKPIVGELLEKYPSEFPAFDLGLYICSAFQETKNSSDVPAIDDNDFDYYKDICSLLKRKSLSPHSLGMIYRSLFIPLRPSKA